MDKQIDLQVVQQANGQFVIYDDTNRAYLSDKIIQYSELADETIGIGIIITSPSGAVESIDIKHKAGATVADRTESPYEFDFDTLSDQNAFEVVVAEIEEPEAKEWTFDITVEYTTGGFDYSTVSKLTEFVFSDVEQYRATIFEKLAKYNVLYGNIGKRVYNDEEIDFNGFRVYDSYFVAMKAAIEVGNTTSADTIYDWLYDYKTLNPLVE